MIEPAVFFNRMYIPHHERTATPSKKMTLAAGRLLGPRLYLPYHSTPYNQQDNLRIYIFYISLQFHYCMTAVYKNKPRRKYETL